MNQFKFLFYSFLFAIFIFLVDEYLFTIFPVKSFASAVFGIVVFSLFFLLSGISPKAKMHFQILYLLCAGSGLFLAGSAVLKVHEHGPEAYKKKLGPPYLKWYFSFDEAKKNSTLQKGNILIYFSAEWCIPCHVIGEKLFPKKEFQDLVEKYKLTLLNIDMTDPTEKNEQIAVHYKLEGLPVMILSDAAGIEIDRLVGFRYADDTIQNLKKILK